MNPVRNRISNGIKKVRSLLRKVADLWANTGCVHWQGAETNSAIIPKSL